MSLAAAALQAFEGAPIPDALRRGAVAYLVGTAARRMLDAPAIDRAFAEDMSARPIAEHAKAANDQHYELPAGFFSKVLGLLFSDRMVKKQFQEGLTKLKARAE